MGLMPQALVLSKEIIFSKCGWASSNQLKGPKRVKTEVSQKKKKFCLKTIASTPA